MEKSELSTRDRMCSVAGGMAGLLVDREIPSRMIPFRGEFPLLNMIEARRFREAIRSTMWIEDLPPKFLYAAAEGSRIARLEREFRHYLSRNGLKSGDFEKLEDAEKSEWLQWWMEADSVSADDFVVKKYRDEATPVSKSLGDPAMPVAEKREIYDDLVTRRAYWDDLCFEFGRVSWEKKLLNLALYIHYGGDLEVVLARYKENHPDYADRIPHSLAYYISYLRTGEATSVLNNFLLERVCLSEGQLTALLTAELRERLEEVFCWDGGTNSAWTVGIDYRGEEKMNEAVALGVEKGREYLIFGNLTIKPFIMETKETLLKENPWRVLAEKIEKNGYMRLEKLNAYADDIPFIEEFNERTKNEPEYQLHTEILPYPFIGDVLDARVVLLMSNPGYKVSSNIEAHEKMSDEEKRFVIRAQTQAMLLEDRAIFYSGPEYKPFNDEQDWYWAKKTRIIREAVPGAETKIAAVQLMAYHSRKYKPFPEKMGLLPSQEYTKRLVKYLIDKKDVIFVYARSKARWLDFVPELENATCVELSSIRNACLSEKNCKDGGFEIIKAALAE